VDWREQEAAAAAAAATKDGRANSRRLDRILISKGVENSRRRLKDERRANIVHRT
jgi:endonuclease/exonuclease/phosphatase family metal-dependent hydrolase